MSNILSEVFDAIKQKLDESDTPIVVIGVEFNQEGYPTSQMTKITGSPSTSIAGLHMVIRQAKDKLDEIHGLIEDVSTVSTKLDNLIKSLGFDNFEDPKFQEFMNVDPKGKELKELLKKLKNQFGK